ncbi:MAG: CoA-binding protein [Bacteroidetes bacterium]|nr:CoA-binding protein [Bacteroidota bacterium]
MKKTLVIGASLNPGRFSYKAIIRLRNSGHEVVAIGLKEGVVEGVRIQKGKPSIEHVDTITLYLNAKRQEDLINYILSLNPRRIIFNPGAENTELMELASDKGIEAIEACTLTMLSIGMY